MPTPPGVPEFKCGNCGFMFVLDDVAQRVPPFPAAGKIICLACDTAGVHRVSKRIRSDVEHALWQA